MNVSPTQGLIIVAFVALFYFMSTKSQKLEEDMGKLERYVIQNARSTARPAPAHTAALSPGDRTGPDAAGGARQAATVLRAPPRNYEGAIKQPQRPSPAAGEDNPDVPDGGDAPGAKSRSERTLAALFHLEDDDDGGN